MRTILFVCTGNTCRSPMAEAIARRWLQQADLADDEEIFVASAGVAAMEGAAVSAEALRTLEALGVPHEGRSKPLTAEMVRRADMVFCMTAGHVAAARALVADEPQQQSKILRLDEMGDLEDPVGQGQAAYDALGASLVTLVPQRLKETLVP